MILFTFKFFFCCQFSSVVFDRKSHSHLYGLDPYRQMHVKILKVQCSLDWELFKSWKNFFSMKPDYRKKLQMEKWVVNSIIKRLSRLLIMSLNDKKKKLQINSFLKWQCSINLVQFSPYPNLIDKITCDCISIYGTVGL